MEIKTIKEPLERLQLLVDKDIIRVRPSDMDEFLSEWQQAIKDIRKALCQQEQAEPVGWQPIETAPMDGTEILVMLKNGDQHVVYGHFYGDEFEWAQFDGNNSYDPILWSPLLAAPHQPKETGE